MQEVYSQKVSDSIMALLQDDEALGPRILQLHKQGFFNKEVEIDEKLDPDMQFPRGETHHQKLTLKNLDFLFRELGLQDETVDALCAKSKLQHCRWLWCWFTNSDMTDKLPANTLRSLVTWAQQRQAE